MWAFTTTAVAAGFQVAITFDDLPFVGVDRGDLPAATKALLAHLERYDAPATGFVNCCKVPVRADSRGLARLALAAVPSQVPSPYATL